MRLSDRTLGYLVLIVLAAILLGLTGLMVHKHHLPRHDLTVLFEDVGSLQPQDRVSMRGYTVGQVGSVTWRGTHAEVFLVFDEPQILREGVVVRNENYSLMGQRQVEIVNPPKGRVLPKDTILRGVFEPGIAEAMHLMEEVRIQIIAIRDLVLLLESGDSLTPSLRSTIENFAGATETLVDQLQSLAERTRPQLVGLLRDATQLSRQTVQITQVADSSLRHGHRVAAAGIRETRVLAAQIDTSLGVVSTLLDSIQAQPFYKAMVEDRAVLDELEEFAAALKVLTTLIDDKGLVVLDEEGKRRSLVTLRNINLFGRTAREKARRREAER